MDQGVLPVAGLSVHTRRALAALSQRDALGDQVHGQAGAEVDALVALQNAHRLIAEQIGNHPTATASWPHCRNPAFNASGSGPMLAL